MSASILVTYATRYGSTQEVAEAVAVILRDGDLEVDVQPIRNVQTLDMYDMVVLGAPLYIGRWHKDAHRFLSQYRKALTQQHVAIFALGPLHNDDEQWRVVRSQLDKELAKYPWLSPVAVEIFGGKYEPAQLRFPDNLIANSSVSPLYNIPATDLRNWAVIRTWAGELAPKLEPRSQELSSLPKPSSLTTR
jgi:menaquinone-dependent protoporphyrinogen oxidase